LKSRRMLLAGIVAAMSLAAIGVVSGLGAREPGLHGNGVVGAKAQMAGPNAEGIVITVDHNVGKDATREFKFAHVPSPGGDDAAMRATLTLVAGEVDENSGGLSRLTDGRVPTEEDEPEANFFFDAGTWGGRFRMDLGSAIEIAAVNSYSWHPNTRGPQVYVLYASDGADPNFDPAPKTKVDPTSVGWRRVASVDTRPKQGNGTLAPASALVDQFGGQYGVSITHASGSIGKFRYLLFDCFETEADDDWGNTFYSEIGVVAKK
jgi:hypothetical protein